MTDRAYKLADAAEWRSAVVAGAYDGSAVDLADGFIHLSTRDQLAETARKHYSGREGLVLLAVDLSEVRDRLRWEPSRGGALFPHLYGDLPASAVVQTSRVIVSSDGAMSFPDGAPTWA